jgi:hypothetical protein
MEAASWALVVATGLLILVTGYYALQTHLLVRLSRRATEAAEASVREMRGQSGRMDDQVQAVRHQVEQMHQQVIEARRAYQASLLALAGERMAKYNDLFVQATAGGGPGWPPWNRVGAFCYDVDAIGFLVEEGFLPLGWVSDLYAADLLTVWGHPEFQADLGREGRRHRFARLVRLCEACVQCQERSKADADVS